MQKKKLNKQDVFTMVEGLIVVILNFYGMCANPGDVIYFLKFAWSLYSFIYKFYRGFLDN
ncbi:hypothetical protein [Intestinibacter sp.]|uniref:hypothetical protein n=1 Tax=Intestinibacter sp. TaxID=1965304 RepID=UPI002A75EA66|nr:hypothetical protein [Intestinibacter sp.]MDY2736530.1 hypothetical protein [Intestinibacter sp.]